MSKGDFFERKMKIKDTLKNKNAHIRFLGAGGVGMYSLVRLTHSLGYTVTGRDRSGGELFLDLVKRGIALKLDSEMGVPPLADIIVYSHAVPLTDLEIVRANECGIATVSRAEYLGALMDDYKIRIGVSGSHGKSTSVGMLAHALSLSGLNSTVISGARLSRGALPFINGGRDYLVYEACEYKDSFLSFSPTLSLFTNLELDHTDYFCGIEDIKRSFLCAINLSRCAVINKADDNLASLIDLANTEIITYAVTGGADYTAENIRAEGGFYSFDALFRGRRLGSVSLSVPGKFNVSNALGVIAALHTVGVDTDAAVNAISSFSGIERRLEEIGCIGKTRVYYDYAHHPTEIRAVIEALREIVKGRIAVIFRPHTYSRTSAFFSEFSGALSLADRVYLCEIDAVRESLDPSVSATALKERIGDSASLLYPDLSNMELEGISALVIMGAADLSVVLEKVKKMIEKD